MLPSWDIYFYGGFAPTPKLVTAAASAHGDIMYTPVWINPSPDSGRDFTVNITNPDGLLEVLTDQITFTTFDTRQIISYRVPEFVAVTNITTQIVFTNTTVAPYSYDFDFHQFNVLDVFIPYQASVDFVLPTLMLLGMRPHTHTHSLPLSSLNHVS